VSLFERLWHDALLRDLVVLGVYMVAGGLLGVFVRALYQRFAGTVSNRDAFSRTFPLLTLATILVIFVVKSSLALSLGLVGALSIVRFRAAIKEPEELVYLFFCIAAGLAIGAEYFAVAAVGTVVFTAFVLAAHGGRIRGGDQSLLLTITGGVGDLPGGSQDLVRMLNQAAGDYSLQRLDLDGDQVQLRAVVQAKNSDSVAAMVATLNEQIPSCRVSYVSLESLL